MGDFFLSIYNCSFVKYVAHQSAQGMSMWAYGVDRPRRFPQWKYSPPSFVESTVGNETIYFAEPYAAQLRADGFAMSSMTRSSNADLMTASRNMTSLTGEFDNLNEAVILQYAMFDLLSHSWADRSHAATHNGEFDSPAIGFRTHNTT